MFAQVKTNVQYFHGLLLSSSFLERTLSPLQRSGQWLVLSVKILDLNVVFVPGIYFIFPAERGHVEP